MLYPRVEGGERHCHPTCRAALDGLGLVAMVTGEEAGLDRDGRHPALGSGNEFLGLGKTAIGIRRAA